MRLAAELAQVTDADGDAGPVAPVEEGDRELAAGADQFAKRVRCYLAVPAAVLDHDRLCLLGGAACVVEVGVDAGDAALALEHAEHLAELAPAHPRRLLELAEIGGREAPLGEQAFDALAEGPGFGAELHPVLGGA